MYSFAHCFIFYFHMMITWQVTWWSFYFSSGRVVDGTNSELTNFTLQKEIAAFNHHYLFKVELCEPPPAFPVGSKFPINTWFTVLYCRHTYTSNMLCIGSHNKLIIGGVVFWAHVIRNNQCVTAWWNDNMNMIVWYFIIFIFLHLFLLYFKSILTHIQYYFLLNVFFLL